MNKPRELWIDYAKAIACILVVFGHFFMSMVESGIIISSKLYQWFISTIYTFHVPLFFVCSGYLYQRNCCINSWKSWRENTLRKAISLGIPYVVFSTITWCMKTVFSTSVNSNIERSLLETLLTHPISPYWYLYCIFFIFLILPTLRSSLNSAVVILLSFLGKVISIYWVSCPYPIFLVLSNAIWFVLGMYIATLTTMQKYLASRNYCFVGIVFLFLVCSLFPILFGFSNSWFDFSLGLLGCSAIVILTQSIELKGKFSHYLLYFSSYTMPVYLMHTLTAAPLRIVLLSVGITSAFVHVPLGLAVSFLGPFLVAKLAERFNFLNFFLYPAKYIGLKKV